MHILALKNEQMSSMTTSWLKGYVTRLNDIVVEFTREHLNHMELVSLLSETDHMRIV